MNVLPIEVPPLRSRKSDILLLAEYFRAEYCRDSKREVKPFDKVTIDHMLEQVWPGNVRELKNHVRRLCIFGNSSFNVDDDADAVTSSVERKVLLKHVVEKAEKEHIQAALQIHKGRITAVYNSQGISRKSLYDKIKKHDIDQESFRVSKN